MFQYTVIVNKGSNNEINRREPPQKPLRRAAQITAFYRALVDAWGPQHWWPARSAFEVIVGAYLTQNTAWTNVQRAIENLRGAGSLNLQGIRETPIAELEQLVRPAGYFRQKSQRLKTFVQYLDASYRGSLGRMFEEPTGKLRVELLGLNGVGLETADSILLYAGNHPVFVVDAYTRRILDRHGILPLTTPYDEIRTLFEHALNGVATYSVERKLETDLGSRGAAHEPSPMSISPRTALTQTLNEMHALIVGAGKNYCSKTMPNCAGCPLGRFLDSSDRKNLIAEAGRR